MRGRVVLAGVLWLSGCGPEPVARSRDAGTEAPSEPAPFVTSELGGTARAVTARQDVALEGAEFAVGPGDFVIESAEAVAVVSATDGRVIAFGAPGGRNGLEGFGPAVFDPFDEVPGNVESIEPVLEGRALRVAKRLRGRPLDIEAWLTLSKSVLLLRWRLTAREAVAAVTPGELLFWGNTPSWVEGHGFVEEGATLSGAFLARESQGVSYAFCSPEGRVSARFRSPDLAGYHRSARTGEQRIALAAGAITPIRSAALALSNGSLGKAVELLPCQREVERLELPAPRVGSGDLEVAHCEDEADFRARREREQAQPEPTRNPAQLERGPGKPYARYRLREKSVEAPRGCARVRLRGSGGAAGAWIDPRRADERGWGHPGLLPRTGTLAWRVRDRDGAVLPAALVVRGEQGTKDPDWGDDGWGGAARNVVYTERDGARTLPPGRYRVVVHRGFEYGLHEARIVVAENQTVSVSATLERVVDTSGWISADLHVHALPSVDAPTLLEDRVRSLAAVGVEVAVATDHNAVTDYRPAIESLGMQAYVASIVGDEVTTDEPVLGHFNVFPLTPGSPPLAFRGAHPRELFARARLASPDGVLQVNHPRMGDIGYFELFHLDRGAVRPWTERAPMVAMDFDAIELFNGDHYADLDELNELLEDWYALLDAGFRYTATGNSDSHKIAYQEAGMPRNFVALERDDPEKLDAPAFVRAVRQGRVVVSSGPFVALSAGGARPGDSVSPGRLEVAITVDGPPWMDVSQIDLVRRGGVLRRWKVTGNARPRFQVKETIQVESGDWILCVVRGKKAMEQLYRSGANPFAFTNPIWVK